MEWFKFYNNKWLSDLAIISLDPIDRLCFITLLCVTASRDERNGVVTQYHEHRILTLTHLSQDEYKRGIGFTKRLEEVGLISIIDDQTIQLKNFEKRQNSMLSDAERAKKYRENKKVTNVTNKSDERHAREEKIREDKRRVDEKKEPSLSFLEKLSEELKNELSDKYQISSRGIQSKATDLLLYCKQKGKVYKDYKAFLENAIRKDKLKLQKEYPIIVAPKPFVEEVITPEQMEKNRIMRENISNMLKSKRL